MPATGAVPERSADAIQASVRWYFISPFPPKLTTLYNSQHWVRVSAKTNASLSVGFVYLSAQGSFQLCLEGRWRFHRLRMQHRRIYSDRRATSLHSPRGRERGPGLVVPAHHHHLRYQRHNRRLPSLKRSWAEKSLHG